MSEDRPPMIDKVLTAIQGIAVLVVFGSLPNRFPEIAGHIALGVIGAIWLFYLAREFHKGVMDAGGWTSNRAVNPPAPNPDAPTESN